MELFGTHLSADSDQFARCFDLCAIARWKPDGRRDRITVRGKTKTEVKDKLRAKHTELAAGIRTPANYTVEQCLKTGWRP